jgi:glycosyltransferase involved in cell wall biosynthesis
MTRRIEFWSSTEYATFLPALVKWLEERGVKARQRFQVSQTDYWAARGRMARLALRARCYGLYPLRVGFRFLWRGRGTPEVGVVCTNTFYAPWVAMVAAGSRGTPVVNWVFDLFPDVLTVAGKLRTGSISERALASIVCSTFHHAAANVFLGEHLLAHAQKRFGHIPRAHIIPIGADAAPFRHHPPRERPTGTPSTVLYCGNLGRMHDVDTVASVIRGGLPAGIRMKFRGNGAGFRALEYSLTAATAGAVSLGGNIQGDDWVEAMQTADVGLVTLRPGAEGLVMPSKTYSAMVAGQALLAVCPESSDLAETVRRHDAGWVVRPGDSAGLRATLAQIADDPEELLRRRENSFNAGQGIYDQVAIAGLWAGLFETVVADRAKSG